MTTQPLPRHSNGSLPHLDGPTVSTPWFNLGSDQAAKGIELRGIVTFSGASGTGKTTTATVAAAQSRMRFVYTKLKNGAGTKDVAEALFRALHPNNNVRDRDRIKERTMVNDSTDTLMAGNIGVIADEVHRIGVPGMLMLSEIWDSVFQATGQGFPLFLVGCNVNAAIDSAEELKTRITSRANFHPLDDDSLLATLKDMDPRCAATPDARLLQANRLWAKGNLREWRKIINFVALNPTPAGSEITVNEIRAYLVNQGQSLKNVTIK